MANDKQNIWLHLADTKAMPLSIDREAEATYREAEKLVNTLWERWMNRFSDSSTSHEVLARVAFQFARLYLETYQDNKDVNDYLNEYEKQLDALVLKLD
ncbi:MAG: cell division protein ZapA [Muribaculaceae bacterium]|nr:cell division protein ZapA [Muribaculaceae bacterium]MBR1475730.1 cell division protein ZapA [Muribaculaceae bacterium]